MPNKPYALEWLQFSYRNLATALHLFEVNHYTDIIVVACSRFAETCNGEALEKMLKALLANENRKISKTHNLDELASLLGDMIVFEEHEMDLLEKTTDYYREDRYPNPSYSLPTREETKEILEFTNSLFTKVCDLVGVTIKDVER